MRQSNPSRFHLGESRVRERTREDLGVTLLHVTFRASLVLTFMIIVLIGLWSGAAVIGGAVAEGGFLELVKSWSSAVSGG